MCDYNKVFKELAKARRECEIIQGQIKVYEDEIKAYMLENELEILAGKEHKATYKEVTQNKIDTTRLKAEAPGVAAIYMKAVKFPRFTFA